MKTVSRFTYTLWSLFYHLLCLSGLIWQVTQISIIFFMFDVNKDITIRMPSEFDFRAGTSVYLCFKMHQLFDKGQSQNLMLMWNKTEDKAKRDVADNWQRKGMSLNFVDLFDGLAAVGEIFQAVLNESIIRERSIIEILFGDNICFTSTKTELDSILFGEKYTWQVNRVLSDVTLIFVALGENYPYFDPQSLIKIENIRRIPALHLRSYSYNMIKKEFPYSDKCYEYRSSKIVNQYEAKIKCYEESLGNEFASYNRIISKNHLHVYNLTRRAGLEELYPNCNQQPPDCSRTVHFTSVRKTMFRDDAVNLHVWVEPEEEKKDLSFTVVSKPRIDNIEFVTYILGALGSWLGFSFLGINPIPYLLTVANEAPSNRVEDLSSQSNNSNYIFSLSNRVARNETKCNESKQELKIDLESKIEQLNLRMNSKIRKLIAEINSLKQDRDV